MSSPASLTADYEQFRQTFFAECSEMLADVDSRLERLAGQGLDREELDAVFRAVHSIKAGAGMFSYTRLVEFAHAFEALLDRLRDGRMTVDAVVARLIVRAADMLAELVSAAQDARELEAAAEAAVGAELHRLLNDPAPEAAHPGTAPEAALRHRRLSIAFRPRAEMLRHANEPLLIVRELKTLGDLEVSADLSALPALGALETDAAYIAWTFDLLTDRSDREVREVFEFVEGDADIVIAEVVTAPADEDDGFGLWLDTPAAPAFEVAVPPAAPSQPALESGPSRSAPQGGTIRVDLSRVDRLVNVVGELVISQAMLRQDLTEQGGRSLDTLDALEALTRELQDCVMAVRMQPVRSLFSRLPRLVRDVADKLGKQVRLSTTGEQTELDKTVIEELSDPLTHMIRNSIDHGIEMPAVRLASGKPAEGTVSLSAAHVGSNIIITLADDGGGIDRGRLYAKAVEKGLIEEGARLDDDEILDLIFAPGFSTAAAVSDLSGRGVGMDVVRRNIQKIGGRIQVASEAGHGTRFTLVIPLTLAVLDGMLVSVGGERYILPLTSIIETFRPAVSQIRTLAGGGRIANVRGDFLPLLGLGRIFGVSDAQDDPTRGLVVLVETATGARLGLVVDELLGQQQVVIKSLQENFAPVAGLSGGTILGDGQVALILDIERLSTLKEQQS